MFKLSTKRVITLAILVGLSSQVPVHATKIPMNKLPRRNGDANGKASYDRGTKDFENAVESVVPVSRFRRRADYRTLEKERKEKEKQRRAEQKRRAIEAHKNKQASYKMRLDQIKRNKQEAIQYNNEAVSFGQQGRWEEAISAHEKAVKLDSSSKEFRVNLSAARTAYGQQKLKAGQTQAAASVLRKALAAAPDNGMAGKLLTEALTTMGLDPGDADVRIRLGDQLKNSRDYQGAYIEYQQAMNIEPSAKTYVKMGDIELVYRRVSEALRWYGQAIVKDPKYAPAHRQLGILYLAQKNRTKAAASLRKALILDSSDHLAGETLVGLWRDQVAKNPLAAENHLGLAGALQLSGDFVGAQSEYAKLEAIDPKNPGLATGRQSLKRAFRHATAEKHRKAAETLFSQGLKREALAEISQAAMMEPRNAKYQFLLGECLESNNDYKGAHQAYLTCVLIDPENNQEAAARMKEMQRVTGGSAGQTSQAPVGQTRPINQPGNQFKPNMMRQTPVNNQRATQRPNSMAAPFHGKSMFENGRVQPQAPAKPMNTMHQKMNSMPQNRMVHHPAAQNPQFQNRSGLGNFGQMVNHDIASKSTTSNQIKPRIFPAAHADNPIANGSSRNDTVNTQTKAMVPNGNRGGANQVTSNPNSAQLAMVSAAEQQNDYAGAIKILRDMLNQGNNLKNAKIHHRLAVNLMAAGEISQAVTEFRIASALKPSEKSYAKDLARALSVNKRSLSHNGAGGNQ